MNPLFTAAFEDRAIAACFSASEWVGALVRVEVALAKAQAAAGVIPRRAAAAIAKLEKSFVPDLARLEAATARDGFPVIGLLGQLSSTVGPEAADFVHWGATTQDIVDTALVSQLKRSLAAIESRLAATSAALAALATRHRDLVMVGRTHLQPAVPTTFGLKAAGWLAPLLRHRARLREIRARISVVQFGGAGGTLAALGRKARRVEKAFASELGLRVPATPWHTQRDRLHEVAGWLVLVASSAGKFANDILLLAQAEVGEVRESRGEGGGSSAMPQKNNPVRSETVLIASRTVAGHLSALLSLPHPEHERGTQSGQGELLHLPAMCALTGGALRAAEQLARELVVNVERVRENVAATHGVMLAEAVTLALARHVDHSVARRIVRAAAAEAMKRKRSLLEIVRERPDAAAAVNELPKDEADYLGSARVFIDRVLSEHAAFPPSRPA